MLYRHARHPFWRRHPVVIGAVALMTFWWLANGWYAAIAITAIVGLLLLVDRRRRAHSIRDAGLRARADYEHRLSLAGDQRGVFGRYPPLQPGWFPDPQTLVRSAISTGRGGLTTSSVGSAQTFGE